MIGDVFGWLDAVAATALPQMVRLALWAGRERCAFDVALRNQFATATSCGTKSSNGRLAAAIGCLRWRLQRRNGTHPAKLATIIPSLRTGRGAIAVGRCPRCCSRCLVWQLSMKIKSFFTLGPVWVRSWITGFLVVTSVAALTTKFVCKID